MRSGRLAVTLVALAAAVGAGIVPTAPALASAPAATGTIPLLRIGSTWPEPTLDPARNDLASVIDQLSLESLLQLGPEGQLEPELATSWAQTSPVTYIYHLRHGVKFWDGDPLTAADVVYSLNYVRAPSSKINYGFPTTVKSITADGPYTVVVTLSRPDQSWAEAPGVAATAGIFEMKFAEQHKGTFGNPGVLTMGTGPWEVDSLDPTRGAELSANPNWWGGKVPIQHISFTFFSSETSEALAMRAGEIDLVFDISDPRSFEATSGAQMLSAPSCWTAFFAFNNEVAPWDDVHVRRAVAYALDRTDIIAANGGYAQPNYTEIPSITLRTVASEGQVNALLSSINLYPYNLAKAKAEMAESAYPHGFSATLLAVNYAAYVNVSQVVAAELGKIGIKVQLKEETLAASEADVPPQQRLAHFSEYGCLSPDPNWFNLQLASSQIALGNNVANYSSPTVDHLLAVGDTTSDRAARFAAYSAIVRQLAVDVPYVPLFDPEVGLALSKKFSYPTYNYWSVVNDYPLGVKPA